MTGPAWLICPLVARVAGDRDGNLDRTRWEARSLPASSGQLLAKTAMDRYDGHGQDPAVGRKRRCHRLDDQRRCQVLKAVVPVHPHAAPAGGWER